MLSIPWTRERQPTTAVFLPLLIVRFVCGRSWGRSPVDRCSVRFILYGI